jgi:hypothetical protein
MIPGFPADDEFEETEESFATVHRFEFAAPGALVEFSQRFLKHVLAAHALSCDPPKVAFRAFHGTPVEGVTVNPLQELFEDGDITALQVVDQASNGAGCTFVAGNCHVSRPCKG